MIPAILRNEIIQKHFSHKNLLLVYQMTFSKNNPINNLQESYFDQSCVYDFTREDSHGNGCFSAQAKRAVEIPIPQ